MAHGQRAELAACSIPWSGWPAAASRSLTTLVPTEGGERRGKRGNENTEHRTVNIARRSLELSRSFAALTRVAESGPAFLLAPGACAAHSILREVGRGLRTRFRALALPWVTGAPGRGPSERTALLQPICGDLRDLWADGSSRRKRASLPASPGACAAHSILGRE